MIKIKCTTSLNHRERDVNAINGLNESKLPEVKDFPIYEQSTRETDNMLVEIEVAGYSERLFSELFDRIPGSYRLPSATRNEDLSGFEYYIPDAIENEDDALEEYRECMETMRSTYVSLQKMGIRREDLTNLLPMGMLNKGTFRLTSQAVLQMAEIALCARANRESRVFITELLEALAQHRDDWKSISDNAKPKCEVFGYCEEKRPCKAKFRRLER